MDDPTRRCENDTGLETRLPGAPEPKRGPHFFCPALRPRLSQNLPLHRRCVPAFDRTQDSFYSLTRVGLSVTDAPALTVNVFSHGLHPDFSSLIL